MIDLDKVSEGVDYQLVPVTDSTNQQAWDVRFLTGLFSECVVRYGNVSFKEDMMTFNFTLISTPDDQVTEDNVDLQQHAGVVLEDIIARAIADGSIVTKDKDGN